MKASLLMISSMARAHTRGQLGSTTRGSGLVGCVTAKEPGSMRMEESDTKEIG